MPAPKKPSGTKQDRRAGRSHGLAVVRETGPAGVEIPPLPTPQGGLLKSSRDAWVQFWSSVPAQAALEVDLVVAERWLVARDEWIRATNAFRRARIVKGSTGQPALNPLATWIQSREAVMAKCEEQLGIGPKSRMNLGIALGQARMTAEEMNRTTEENDAGDDEVIDAEEEELLEGFEEA